MNYKRKINENNFFVKGFFSFFLNYILFLCDKFIILIIKIK